MSRQWTRRKASRATSIARALHAAVEVDQEIPPEHYKAVAEVIGYVMKLRRATGQPRWQRLRNEDCGNRGGPHERNPCVAALC